MKAILTYSLYLLTAGLAVLAAAAGLSWYLIARSLPDYDRDWAVTGLGEDATIVRDANAVPHIRAGNSRDAWFALGVVHAQDRLWQMELARRAARGRLSAYFGNRTIPQDRLVKTLDIYGRSRASLEHQTPETREILEAYSKGVNAWIRTVDAEALGRGAPEFFLFTGGIAPWTPQDSLAILKNLALRLSASAQHEIRRGLFHLNLDPERVRDILPEYPLKATTTAPRFSELFPGARFTDSSARDPSRDGPWFPARRPEFAGASNAWAVDGTRASHGKPLLASDPHLGLQAPSLWHLVDVQGGETRVIGGAIPGIPAILIGHNGRVGWGLSTTGVDDQDVFIERVNPENPAEYLTPKGWESFRTRPIRIEVADGPDIDEQVRETRHGPVLSRGQLGAHRVTPEGYVAALSWTGLHEADTTMSGLVRLMEAGTLEDVIAASALAITPAQNVTMADATGIGMVVSGAVPERRADSGVKGRLPSPGWLPQNDWQGFRPPGTSPVVLHPSEGAIANANNRVTNAEFPDHLSFDWDHPYRINRVIKELSRRDVHSRDSFVMLQNDTVSEMARSVLPLIARKMWWSEPEKRSPQKDRALEALRDWTGDMSRHGPEPLIFSEWMRRLTRRLALDELGPLYPEIEGMRPLFIERVFRDADGASIWCDVDKTPERETCDRISELALDDALAALTDEFGPKIETWRWGRAHRAVHRHYPLGFMEPLGVVFNIEHETAGGNFTVMRGLSPGRGSTPYENVHASGLRVVYDFADLDRSLWIISTGQSGHPFSRWYGHLADLWAGGEMIPMSMSDRDAHAGAVGITKLRPK